MTMAKRTSRINFLAALTVVALAPGLRANPAGGQVAAGAANIAGQGTTSVTISQSSQTAIINWKSFSIGSGEATKFVQPNSTSATLNRVLGGQTSIINGTLSANGQVFLINGNGILVGPGGVIITAGFTASTRDISDADFLSGNLHFTGNGDAGVQNLGTIDAVGGNVYLIGKTVDNQGSIRAPAGTVGLAAGDDVLLAQKNADGSTITVQPSVGATPASGKTGVSNSGSIQATSAELKAANGNIYALAINNSGSIRATTVTHQGGHIYLTADSGTIVNSGVLDASATAAGGQGGTVALKNMDGTTIHSGRILARGGAGGAGGNAEISGRTVQFTGTVDLTATDGTTGQLLFDPENVTIQTNGPTTATASGSPTDTYTGSSDDSIVTVADLENALANANVVVTTGNVGSQAGDITVNDAVSWGSANSLTLSAYHDININADLTNTGGASMVFRADNTGTGVGTVNFAQATAVTAAGGVAIFYNPSVNPASSQVNSTSYVNPTEDYSTHVVSGTTLTAYMLVNTVYDLQNMQNNLTGTYALGRDIDASTTTGWNSGAGFHPIGFYDGSNSSDANSFDGTFNGQGHTIDGLYVNVTGSTGAGLFGDTGNDSLIEDVNLTHVLVTGTVDYAGGLTGVADGTYSQDTSSGTVNGSRYVGGLLGISYAAISQVSSAGSVNATGDSSGAVGGLIGFTQGGTLSDSYSSANITVGTNAFEVGGLVGDDAVATHNTYSSGSITAGTGSSYLGGLVGTNGSTIDNSFYDTDTVGSQVTSGAGEGSTSGITPATSAQLGSQTFILANAPVAPTWNFTPGTGIWAINGGLPYLQLNAQGPGTGSGGGSSGGGGSGGGSEGGSGSSSSGSTSSTQMASSDQFQSQQSDYARQVSHPVIKLVGERIALASFSGDGINTGESVDGEVSDLGRGSFEGEMVTPTNGTFGIVSGTVVTTPLPPGAAHKFQHAFDPDSLDQLHHAAAGAP
jgi:filamentous hemagglutinin family protein